MASSVLVAFAVTFAVVGGVEFFDRTFFALLGFSAKHRAGHAWAGAAAAFVVTTGLAVAIGTTLLSLLGGHLVYLRLAGGGFLLAYAAYLTLVPETDRAVPSSRSVFLAAFLLIFLLELGDTTMIFVIVFVATFQDPIVVFAAGAIALSGVAAAACLLGVRIGARVEPRLLERLVIVILAIVGSLTILFALDPGLFPALA